MIREKLKKKDLMVPFGVGELIEGKASGLFKVWLFKEVVAFKDGKSFGELALITSKPRAATIVCKQDCDFAVLDKQDY